MKRSFSIPLILILGCVVSTPALAKNSDRNPAKKSTPFIVLMPIHARITRMTMKAAEPMMDAARDAELPLALEMEAALRERGYQLDFKSMSSDELAEDPDQHYLVDDLQKQFDSQLQLMRHKSGGVRRGRFTLGDAVLQLPLSDKADALLFVRVNAQILTENKKTFGTFVAGAGNDLTVLEFGLVDARTGDVIYFAQSKLAGNLFVDSEEIASGIAKAFANLPKAGPSLLVSYPGSSSSLLSKAPGTLSREVVPPRIADHSDTNTSTRRIPLSSVVLKGLLINKVRPQYPGIALSSHIEGDVIMRVVIDRNGQVVDVTVVSGPIQLIPAATAAVKQWSYRPLIVDGQVFEIETQIVMTFKSGS